MMRKGILTPNLQVLYGLCLISEGNRDFLAEKMIGAIKDIEDSDDEGQNLEATHGPSSNTSSLLFRQAMTSSMNKLDAFAFTSDVIKQLNMEQQWSDRLLPYFQDYLEELDAMKASDILKENSANLSMQRALRRNKYVKVMFSTFRMKIFSGEDSATNACGNERMLKKACDLSYSVIQDIFRFQDALWGTKADGNPTEDTVDVSILYWYSSLVYIQRGTRNGTKLISFNSTSCLLLLFRSSIFCLQLSRCRSFASNNVVQR